MSAEAAAPAHTVSSLADRHALVTGGSRGIGLAIARQLLDLGARVTLMGREEEALRVAARQLAGAKGSGPGNIAWVAGDIASHDDVQRALDQARKAHGPVDILINNAGQAASQRFDRLDEAGWQRMLAVNLTGTFHCMQAALPDMRRNGWGRIVNVASTAGLKGYAYVSAYCAAKHGVIGLTRAVALEVAGQGVTVNAVCPGYTETDIVREAVANISAKTGGSAEQALGQLTARNPQGRLVQPEQVAQAVSWLCLPGADAVNGQAIAIDGGELAG